MAPERDELLTPRLRLRRWRPEDEAPLRAINADPRVAEHLNRPTDAASLDAFFGAVVGHWDEHGFGFFALERRDDPHGRLLGFAGVAHPAFLPALAHRPELGWRLDPSCWGAGLATEAACAARDHARDVLRRWPLISIIHPANRRSQRVAVKAGMAVESQVFNPWRGCDVDVWSTPAA